ncbi:MAG: hypothetical protein Tsb0018_08190 [Opitutales bacterium]|tara:strand:+ start:792 stop:1112 length:321 start_codon:yes stop_codon:yes gene_type:complete
MKTFRKYRLYACLAALFTFVSPLFSIEKETVQGVVYASEGDSGFLDYVYALLNRLATSGCTDAPGLVSPFGGFVSIEDYWLEIELIEQQRQRSSSQKKNVNFEYEN